ncbi:MAG: hypothetical protein RL227_593 [Pseudomonadota bacterium]|jgi:hypothetical protein
MIGAARIEAELRRAKALAYPWLHKVRRLPDCGVPDTCGLWHGSASANEVSFTPPRGPE